MSGVRGGDHGAAYNLTVEGIHAYHVDNDAILVHNVCQIIDRYKNARA